MCLILLSSNFSTTCCTAFSLEVEQTARVQPAAIASFTIDLMPGLKGREPGDYAREEAKELEKVRREKPQLRLTVLM